MSIINISDITVLSNQAKFTDPYLFKITFECMAPLQEDLEWKLIYVGSAESESFDQELDTCMVGPVPVGVNSFEFEAAPPLPSRIPSSELLGVTVILLTCSYSDQEFVRIGYYVNTEYGDPILKAQYDESLEEGAAERGVLAPDPSKHIESLVRNVLVEKPRVTRFNIKWDTPAAANSFSNSRDSWDADSTSTLPPAFQPEPKPEPTM
ncbi:anti-silencing protein [Meredithblackwellia eburnea MCA 4105]